MGGCHFRRVLENILVPYQYHPETQAGAAVECEWPLGQLWSTVETFPSLGGPPRQVWADLLLCQVALVSSLAMWRWALGTAM